MANIRWRCRPDDLAFDTQRHPTTFKIGQHEPCRTAFSTMSIGNTLNMRLLRPTCLHGTEDIGEIGNDVLVGSIVAGKHRQLESPSTRGTMFANFLKKIHPHRTT